MGEEGFDFLQEHSLRFLEMAFRTDRRESIENPDGYGKRSGACGDTAEIFLTVRDGRIQSVSYATDGCLHTNACANAVAELVEGKDLDDAWEIRPENIIYYLQTLPEDHYHCAELVVGAFYRALKDSQDAKGGPNRP